MSDVDEVWLTPGVIDCDAIRLEALSREGSRGSLAAAAGLYQSSLLADVTIEEEAWENWIRAERQRLEGLALDAMTAHAAQTLHAGNAASAFEVAHRAITLNVLREDAHRLVVQALAAMGRRAEALKHYEDLVALLRRELNTEPDAVTRSLADVLRTRTGITSETIDHYIRAGRLAYARSANREAVECFDQALGALASLPESPSTLEQSLDIRLELPQALIQLGDVRRALERLQEAQKLAERLDDDRRLCRLLGFTTIVHALLGELDEALLVGEQALGIARRFGETKLIIPATTILQQVHFYRGDHDRVAALARENLALMPADSVAQDFGLATPPAVYDRGRLILSLAELGCFAEATEWEVSTLQLAAQTLHAYTIGWAYLTASCLYLLKGDWERASPGIEHATAVLRTGGVVPLLPFAVGLSAWNLAQLGNASEALSRLWEGEQLLERHALSGQTGSLGWFYVGLGRAALLLGRLQHARRLADRALQFSPRHPGFAAHALQLLGDVASHPDSTEPTRGEAHYREALSFAEPRRMRPVVAHCHFGLGRLYRRKDDEAGRERADKHFTIATTMYREMGMQFWEEQANAAMGEHLAVVGTPERPTNTPASIMVTETPSIAVLPFENMSGDLEEEYFAEGITADIITALTRFRELLVVARGSSFAFKGKGLTLRQIAGQLRVQYVLNGSIRKVGGRIRVSAELNHAESDVQVWSGRYDRVFVDALDLQDDISQTIAAVVEPAVRDAEIERARRKPPDNLSAYDLYLRALPHLWAGTGDEIAKAIALLRQSLELDATRNPALAALAWGLVMALPLGAVALPETRIEALRLARRAVEQDTNDSFAQAVYGFTLFGPVGESEQGRIHAREAVRVNPSSAFAWGVLGMIDSMSGEYKNAIKCLERAVALSPYDTLLHMWMTGLTAACFGLELHGEGIVWARKSIQQNPGNGTGHRMLAANLAAAGHLEEARDVTRDRNAAQTTTIAELRTMRYFKQDEVLERYLLAQRMAGISE